MRGAVRNKERGGEGAVRLPKILVLTIRSQGKGGKGAVRLPKILVLEY